MNIQSVYKAAMQYGDKPEVLKYTLWWINDDRDVSMFIGNFESFNDAQECIPLAMNEMFDTCDLPPDEGFYYTQYNYDN